MLSPIGSMALVYFTYGPTFGLIIYGFHAVDKYTHILYHKWMDGSG